MFDLLLLPNLARAAAWGALLVRSALGAAVLRQCQLLCLADTHLHSYANLLRSGAVPLPALAAHLSCTVLLLGGVGLIAGFATRWAALGCAVHFAVAASLLCAHAGAAAALPAVCASLGSLGLALLGGGGIGIDGLIERSVLRRSYPRRVSSR